MKKKVWIIKLCCFLLFGMLLGCSNNPESANKKMELTYWTMFGGGDAAYMQEIVNQFNETHPNIRVKNIQLAWDEYYTKLVTGFAAGKGPDIAVSHVSRLPQLVNLEIVSELDPLAEKMDIEWETFNQNILDATMFRNKHYAIPIDTHPLIFYYNKKHLKAAGLLDESGKPIMEQSPQGFIDFFIRLKEALPKDVITYSFPTSGDDPYRLWWALYHQLGGDGILSEDLQSPDIDFDKAIEAANYMKALYHDYKVIPLHIGDFYQMFQSGSAAVLTTGVWATGIWEQTKDLEFGALPLPNIFEKEATWGDSHTLILPKNQNASVERQKAAITFANFVAEKTQIWAKAGHIPAKDTVVQSKEFKEMPYRSEYANAANNVDFPEKSVNNWPVKDILIRNLDTIWNGSASPEEAFRKIDQEIGDLLDKSLLTESP